MKTLFVLLAAAVAAGFLVGGTGSAQEDSGAVAGVVFHDLDGDGVRDEGEPGLAVREVVVENGGREVTDEDGAYAIDAGAGEHMLRVEVDQSTGTCVDTLGWGFYPFDGSWCVKITNPWRATTPQAVTVNVTPGMIVEVNFGLQPVDVVWVAGNAILEDDLAPSGSEIQAFVGREVCGSTTVRNDELNFNIQVLGNGERPGCAIRGDEVRFAVGGIAAAETITWEPFVELTTFGDYLRADLTAMRDHAWYWFHDTGEFMSYEGAAVEALVGGLVCGETKMEFGGGIEGSPATVRIVGFGKLLVPSDALSPGCGRAGATVTFTIDGRPAGSIPWQPGLQEIELGLRLPDTGSGGRSVRSSSGMGLVVLGVLGVLTLGAGGLLLRRR